MQKYIASLDGEKSLRQLVDKDTGEVIDIRDRLASLNPCGSARGNIPSLKGKKSPKLYTQLSTVGAHVMAMARLTGRQYQVMLLIIREANRSGAAMIHPAHIAEELEMDVSDVRKAIKVLDERSFLYKSITKSGGYAFNLNPIYFYHDDRQKIEAQYQTWLRFREAERRKAKPAAVRKPK